jgi:hypothetical protein
MLAEVELLSGCDWLWGEDYANPVLDEQRFGPRSFRMCRPNLLHHRHRDDGGTAAKLCWPISQGCRVIGYAAFDCKWNSGDTIAIGLTPSWLLSMDLIRTTLFCSNLANLLTTYAHSILNLSQ